MIDKVLLDGWSQNRVSLEYTPSTYYYHLKQLNQEDKNQAVKSEIQTIYTEYKGIYGYRRITLELRNRGFIVNHKKVQRLMKIFELSARIRRKRKYSSYHGEVGKKTQHFYENENTH